MPNAWILFASTAVFTVAMGGTASAAVPERMTLQGQLGTEAGPVSDGTYTLEVSLYDGPGTATPIWSEVHAIVSVTDGRFSVLLGGKESFVAPVDVFGTSDQLWVGVSVDGGTELPRTALASVAYAFHAAFADDADRVGGFAASSVPAPGTLLALDAGGKIPKAALPQPGRHYHGRAVVGPDDPAEVLLHFEDAAHIPSKVRVFLKGYRFPRVFYTELGSHAHTASAAAAGNHGHTVENAGTHAHAISDAGLHAHTVDAVGPHTHAVDAAGSHTHTVAAGGSHSHAIRIGDAGGAGKPGDHSFDGTYATSLCAWQAGWVSLVGCSTGASGNYNVSTAANHDHGLSTNGSHDHTVQSAGAHTPTVQQAGQHGHTAAAAGDHAHTVGAAGSHEHAVTVDPTGAPVAAGSALKEHASGLRVTIDGKDVTIAFLALLGWSELGDGTSTHPFVTMGTGVIDITSLVTLSVGSHSFRMEIPNTTGGTVLYDLFVD